MNCKNCLTLTLLLLSVHTWTLSSAQSSSPFDSINYVFIQIPKSLPEHLPFNKFIVLDNRKDTSSLGYDYEARPVEFPGPLNIYLKGGLQYILGEKATGNNTALINVRELSISTQKMVFSGDFYQKVGDSSIIYLGSINGYTQAFRARSKDYHKEMNQLIGRILWTLCDTFVVHPAGQEVNLAKFQELNSKIRSQPYPVLQSGSGNRAGKYFNLTDFKNDNSAPCEFSMMENPDSTYSVVTETPKKKRFLLQNTWGVVDASGNRYFHVWDDKFVRLQKIRDTFYVHIPVSLPSMNYVAKFHEAKQADSAIYLPNLKNLGISGLLYGAAATATELLIDYGTFAIMSSAQSHKYYLEGLKCADYRDFAIDLETGSIIYQRPAWKPYKPQE